MKPIRSLEDILDMVKSKPNKKLSIANGLDKHTLEAAAEGIKQNLVDVINFGSKNEIEKKAKELDLDIS